MTPSPLRCQPRSISSVRPSVNRHLTLSIALLSSGLLSHFAAAPATAQETLLFEGTLRCRVNGQYRPASGTVVRPTGDFATVITVTNSVGYYPFRLPKRPIIDRTIAIRFAGRDSVDLKRVFVGRENIGPFDNVRLPTVNSRHLCLHIEQGDSIVELALARQPPPDTAEVLVVPQAVPAHPAPSEEDEGDVTTGAVAIGLLSALLAGSAGSAFLAGGGDGAPPNGNGAGPPLTPCRVDGVDLACSVGIATAVAGVDQFAFRGGDVFSMAFASSLVPGFHLAPSRELSSAVLWNPAALSLADRPAIAARGDFDHFGLASASTPVEDRASVGVGLLVVDQSEDAFGAKSQEWVAAVGAGVEVTPRLSVGFAVKYIKQNQEHIQATRQAMIETQFVVCADSLITLPSCAAVGLGQILIVSRDSSQNTDFVPLEASDDALDADFGFVWRATRSTFLGVTAANIFNTKLPGVFGAGLRSLGIGANFLLGRANFGLEARLNQNGFHDYGAGVDVVVQDRVSFRGGMTYSEVLTEDRFRTIAAPTPTAPTNTIVVTETAGGSGFGWSAGLGLGPARYALTRNAVWGVSHIVGLTLPF